MAAINGYISLVESLVKLGADVNSQEQCSGRTSLHLAVDLQNPTLVRCLLNLGANVNCSNYGGFTPYHLTYGRDNEEIRCQLYERTAQELRELPDSESDESDMEDADLSEDEVSFQSPSGSADRDESPRQVAASSLTFPPLVFSLQLYDDIKFGK